MHAPHSRAIEPARSINASVLSQKYLGTQTIYVLPTASVLVKEAGMAWRSCGWIELDEAERCELEARTRRRKISRADAMRAATCFWRPMARPIWRSPSSLGSPASRWRLGASGSPPNGWTALPTSPPWGSAQDRDEKIAEVVTTTLETIAGRRDPLEYGSMAKPRVCRSRPCIASGGRSPPAPPERNFKLSADPLFVEQGARHRRLYLNADTRWCSASMRKSQIQALDRTQPLLTMRPGASRTAQP